MIRRRGGSQRGFGRMIRLFGATINCFLHLGQLHTYLVQPIGLEVVQLPAASQAFAVAVCGPCGICDSCHCNWTLLGKSEPFFACAISAGTVLPSIYNSTRTTPTLSPTVAVNPCLEALDGEDV